MDNSNNNWQTLHALAVQCHNQAFIAEAERKSDAKLKWKKALHYWELLFKIEEFWQSLKNRGKILEPSLFESDEKINDLKDAFPKFLLGVHTSFILDYINQDFNRAKYHFEIIRDSNLGQTNEDSEKLKEKARWQIYEQRFREDLLEQGEEDHFQTAVDLAEPIHLIDPTERTSQFMLDIYLKWVQSYEYEQLEIIRENYPEYSEIISKTKSGEDEFEYLDFEEDIFVEINEDEEIHELQEEQATLMDDLEATVMDALEFCNMDTPSNKFKVSQALYFVGRHYCTTHEERDIDTAIDYLEEAIEKDSLNKAAKDLLDQLNDLENR